MQQFVRTLGRIFWVISIAAIICVAQGEGDLQDDGIVIGSSLGTIISADKGESYPRDVVQASEILGKIERGEPVDYAHKIIEGKLSIDGLKLAEAPRTRDIEAIAPYSDRYYLSENLKVIRAPIILKDCLIDEMNFSNALILGPISIWNCMISTQFNLCGSEFNQTAIFSDLKGHYYSGADFYQSRFNLTDFRYASAL